MGTLVALKALLSSSDAHPQVARPEVTGTCSWLKFIALNFLFICLRGFSPIQTADQRGHLQFPTSFPPPLPFLVLEVKKEFPPPRCRDAPCHCVPGRGDRWSLMLQGRQRGIGTKNTSTAHGNSVPASSSWSRRWQPALHSRSPTGLLQGAGRAEVASAGRGSSRGTNSSELRTPVRCGGQPAGSGGRGASSDRRGQMPWQQRELLSRRGARRGEGTASL